MIFSIHIINEKTPQVHRYLRGFVLLTVQISKHFVDDIKLLGLLTA